MNFYVCLTTLVILSLYVDSISAALGVCSGAGYCKEADFKTIGCYRDKMSDRALPHYIYNERDPTHSSYGGRLIEWYNWNNWLPGFACRCAAKAKALGYDIFGVQFWGECWAGHKSDNLWSKHGTLSHCYGDGYAACQNNERFCAGANETNMIYELVDMTCTVNFEAVGCFKDNHNDNRPMGDYILNDRDPSTSSYSGQMISWMNWDTHMPYFACRCAKKAQELGHTFFGTQFYGECWTSSTAKDTFAIDGAATSCIDRCYKPCAKNEDRCIGEHYTNYVYRVKSNVCEVNIQEVGCYKENPENRLLNEIVYTAVEPRSSAFFGELLGERAFDEFFPDFLCKCARIAKSKGHTTIGISDKGVCYSSSVNDNYSTLGITTTCGQGSASTACTAGAKKCAGMDENTNYIYTLS